MRTYLGLNVFPAAIEGSLSPLYPCISKSTKQNACTSAYSALFEVRQEVQHTEQYLVYSSTLLINGFTITCLRFETVEASQDA